MAFLNFLNVIYDITVLGFSIVNQQARTGVFRYIENLRNGLLDYKGIKVHNFVYDEHSEYAVSYLKKK